MTLHEKPACNGMGRVCRGLAPLEPTVSHSFSLLARRLLAVGPDGLSDEELAAVVLGGVRAGEGAIRRAARALVDLDRLVDGGGLVGSGADASGDELRLLAAVALGRRWIYRTLRRRRPRPSLGDAGEIYSWYGPLLAHQVQEHVYAIALDAKLRLITDQCVSIGTVTSCAADVRDVFRMAVRVAAFAVALVHNHPSGNAMPSPEDMCLTQHLEHAGSRLGIELVDHVIIGRGQYYSFRDERLVVCDEVEAGRNEMSGSVNPGS